MPDRVLVFDMDGVLVDVTESYREAIQCTVEHFTGNRVTRELIQQFKNAGGWNNDWNLSHRLIRDAGVEVAFEEVVDQFNVVFMGENNDGLIVRERWVAAPGLLDRLEQRYRFAIFTGRSRFELDPTLRRVGMETRFDPLITHETVVHHKPAADGLLMIAAHHPGAELWYVGDTVDDAGSAQAAGVPFIGISAPDNPYRHQLTRAFREAGAVAVLDDINQLESVLPQ
jgi:HAD superfamily phosphatase